MRRRRGSGPLGDLSGSPILVGAVAVLLTVVGVFLSYNANEGLPFVPTYGVKVDVPDAAELVARRRGADRRRPGRPGQLDRGDARVQGRGRPYARLELALDVNQGPLPADSQRAGPAPLDPRLQVPRADAGETREDASPRTAPCRCRRPTPSWSSTRRSTCSTARRPRGCGTRCADWATRSPAAATSFNEAIASTRRAAAADPAGAGSPRRAGDRPAGFIAGAAAATGALAPVAPTLGSLIDRAAVTLAALGRRGRRPGRDARAAPANRVGRHARAPALDAGPRRRSRDRARAAAGRAAAARRQLPSSPTRWRRPRRSCAIPRASRCGAALAGLDRFVERPRRAELGQEAARRRADAAAPPALSSSPRPATGATCSARWARNLASAGQRGRRQRDVAAASSPSSAPTRSSRAPRPTPSCTSTSIPTKTGPSARPATRSTRPASTSATRPASRAPAAETTLPPPGVSDLARRAGLLVPVPEDVR